MFRRFPLIPLVCVCKLNSMVAKCRTVTALACLSFVLTGCSTKPRIFAIPTHIDLDVATGAWRVVTAGTGGEELLPETIGVFSNWQGERREGVWIVPGTVSAANMLVAKKRGYIVDETATTQIVYVPQCVEPDRLSWTVQFRDKRVGVSQSELQSLHPLMMRVPVRRWRGAPGLNASIERGVGVR